jgi:hypothetical protein
MRPLHNEHHGSKACNDVDSRPTLRTGVHRIYRAAPFDAQAWTEVQTGLSPGFSPHLVEPLHGDAVEVPARTDRPQWATLAIHYTTVYKVFAKWADDGSLWQAFVASVAHLSSEKRLGLSVLHGDGTNTVAQKGGTGLGIRDTNTKRARKS